MRKSRLWFLGVYVYLSILLPAQTYQFQFDYSQFRADSTSNLVEFYYQFNTTDFTIRNIDSHNIISPELIFEISKSKTNKIISSDTLHSNYNLEEISKGVSSKDILGIFKTILPSGKYLLNIKLVDNFSGSVFSNTDELLIESFTKKQPLLSDIQLSNSIMQDTSNEDSPFTKNTLKIIPNPTTSYSSDSPLLQYYVELYNVKERKLKFTQAIISGNSKLISSTSKSLFPQNESIVQIGQINLLKYPTGIYTIQIIISDSLNNYAYSSNKQFYLYNKYYTQLPESVKRNSDQSITSPFAFMSGEECDDVFDKISYIAKDQEKDQYQKLTTIEGKREFLTQFWVKRSSTSTANKFKEYDYYMQRVDEANHKFGSKRRQGFKTDRGRVYVTYGSPNRIDRYPNEAELKPYEIWYYDNLEGGVIFVFGDLTGFSDYELLHSTKRGEIFDDSWQRKLYNY